MTNSLANLSKQGLSTDLQRLAALRRLEAASDYIKKVISSSDSVLTRDYEEAKEESAQMEKGAKRLRESLKRMEKEIVEIYRALGREIEEGVQGRLGMMQGRGIREYRQEKEGVERGQDHVRKIEDALFLNQE